MKLTAYFASLLGLAASSYALLAFPGAEGVRIVPRRISIPLTPHAITQVLALRQLEGEVVQSMSSPISMILGQEASVMLSRNRTEYVLHHSDSLWTRHSL
jgi:hypothetical protein